MELYMWPCLDSFINAMISRSFPVLAPVRTPFLPMDEWFIMCRHLLIHSFSNRHLDWSQFLAIVKVIYRDSRQVFVWIHIFYSLGYTLSSRVPGSDGNSVINLWESCLIDTLATLLSSMGTGGLHGLRFSPLKLVFFLFGCWKLAGAGENVEEMEGFHTVSNKYWDSHHEALKGSASKS